MSIIAAAEIEDYRLRSQHPDYGDATFHLQPGDVIADGGYFEFEPDKLFDPLHPPLGSCFRFVSDPRLRKGIGVRFHDDEYVVVEFPPERASSGSARWGPIRICRSVWSSSRR